MDYRRAERVWRGRLFCTRAPTRPQPDGATGSSPTLPVDYRRIYFFVGLAYGYCAWTNRAPRFFIAMGAAGKLVFFINLVGCWLAGDLPLQTPLLGSADFVFGSLFIAWLIQGYRS